MTLSHEVAGDGPVVVLLHSGVCDRRMWEPQWPALLDAGYRLVRPDFRGYGDTPAPVEPYNDAEDIRELLDLLGVDDVAVVGSSFGGRVAVEFAARWPERVRSLVLLCSAIPGHEPAEALRAFIEREDALLEKGDIAAAVELNVENWLGPEAGENARDAVRRMQRHAFDVQLAVEEVPSELVEFDPAAIRARCLVVSGGHDLPDFAEIADRLHGAIPGAQRLDLPWAGHLPSLERPAEVTELLAGFLRDSP